MLPQIYQEADFACLDAGSRKLRFRGRWIDGGPWERFGFYNAYVVLRRDGAVMKVPAHAGDLVPGSTEDLMATLGALPEDFVDAPASPMSLELDVTYRCSSIGCGGRCFSAQYRSQSPGAAIDTPAIEAVVARFAGAGGRILRFDGGGDPLMHPNVRNGRLPLFARRLALKSTLLTAGDLLTRANLPTLAEAHCYVRVSMDAATEATRAAFHGNCVPLKQVIYQIEQLAAEQERQRTGLPIGATFLLDAANYREVADCALLCRDAGVSHFSVRRVLGPLNLRPSFSLEQLGEIDDRLREAASLGTEKFRVFVPWRPINEPDQNPAAGDFAASRCWQSTFKSVIEPRIDRPGVRGQLCGRYRGGGVGQQMQLPEVFSSEHGDDWLVKWRASFFDYPYRRTQLLHTCSSCIDRGFIELVDRLVEFLGPSIREFDVLHLASDNPRTLEVFPPSTQTPQPLVPVASIIPDQV